MIAHQKTNYQDAKLAGLKIARIEKAEIEKQIPSTTEGSPAKAPGKKIGACQSRADQQAPFEQRSLHTFVSERLRGRHRIFQRVNPVTGCAF